MIQELNHKFRGYDWMGLTNREIFEKEMRAVSSYDYRYESVWIDKLANHEYDKLRGQAWAVLWIRGFDFEEIGSATCYSAEEVEKNVRKYLTMNHPHGILRLQTPTT